MHCCSTLSIDGPTRSEGLLIGLVNTMAEHGHLDDALAYLNDGLPGDRFPLSFLGNLSRECRDDEQLLKLLRAAIRGWKEHPPEGEIHEGFARLSFVGFFTRHWNLLPRKEAVGVLKEIVAWTFRVPPKLDMLPPGAPEFSSGVEKELFVMLPALQELDPEFTETLFERYPQLADAAKVLPQDMRPLPVTRPKIAACDDFLDHRGLGLIPMTEALATDFDAGFQEAYDCYAKDSDLEDPNAAPKECWPSAREFRNILFKAGQYLGLSAEKYLLNGSQILTSDFSPK